MKFIKNPFLLAILFLALFVLKVFSPFLHAHTGIKSEMGFHVPGLSSISVSASIDRESISTESESFELKVADSRYHSSALFVAITLLAVCFITLLGLFTILRPISPRYLFALNHFVDPKSPPPPQAPPIARLKLRCF